jgi:hypothetical protein
MFTRTYFTGRYWAPTYWPVGGTSTARVPSFSVRRGFEGPQNVLNWVPPDDSVASQLVIVRKIGGYPTGINDGVIVVSDTTPFTKSSYSDQDVLHGVIYYYKVFVQE